MGDTQQYVVMCTNPDTSKVFYIDAAHKFSSTAPSGYQVRIPNSPTAWNSMAYQEKKDSVEVTALPFSQTVPTPLISTWPSGPVENYAHGIGFRYIETTPKDVTASMLLELRSGGLKSFNLIVGGPVSTPSIRFQNFLGLEGRAAGGPDSTFSVKIDPAEINFIPNRSVSEFVPIADLFRGSLTHAGVTMDWTKGSGIYARLVWKTCFIPIINTGFSRFRLAMEQNPTTSLMTTKLVLEAAVFEEGYVWPSQGEPVKTAMEKSSSSAIPLWEIPVSWHRPLSNFSLLTTPGINYYSSNGLACTDPQLRWGMSWVVNECRKGKFITSATEWTEYIKDPTPTYPTRPTRHSFVVTFSPDPVFSTQNSGRRIVHVMGQAGDSIDDSIYPLSDKISVVRGGEIVNIIKPSKRQIARKATPTALPWNYVTNFKMICCNRPAPSEYYCNSLIYILFSIAETPPAHYTAGAGAVPGFPTAVSDESLQANSQAALAEMHSMRHQGPKPGGSHQQFLGETQTPQQLISTTDYLSPSSPVNPQQSLSLSSVNQPPLSLSSVNQPPPGSAVAPTVYIKYCNKCNWHSIPTTDGAAYSGAVSDLESHKKEAHPESKDTGEFSMKSKDYEEYKLATTLRDVQACQDDGVNNLCPVRFWSSPISWKNCQLALPLEQSPVCSLREFEPLGLEVNNRKLVRDIHSLGLKSPKLSDFSDVNLKIVPSQQDTFVGLEKGDSGRIFTKKVLKEIATTREAIKAVSNYRELMRMIHPLYSGPQILFKVKLIFWFI